MSSNDPVTTLDARFSVPDARPTPWSEARQQLGEAGAYWLSTVRADGRPHVTTLMAVWHGDALYFSTGPTEQKARNLEQNQKVILTTGCNDISRGLDVVVEGRAVRVRDDGRLRVLAAAWEAKYGPSGTTRSVTAPFATPRERPAARTSPRTSSRWRR